MTTCCQPMARMTARRSEAVPLRPGEELARIQYHPAALNSLRLGILLHILTWPKLSLEEAAPKLAPKLLSRPKMRYARRQERSRMNRLPEKSVPMCVSMYVSMYACICVCMSVCLYVCIHVCIYACIYVCMHIQCKPPRGCRNRYIDADAWA